MGGGRGWHVTEKRHKEMGIFLGRKCGGEGMMQVCIKNRTYCRLKSDVISEAREQQENERLN